jgi:hypothetical protein
VYRKFNQASDALNYRISNNNAEKHALHEKLNGAASITINDLRRVSLWKSNGVLSVSLETLRALAQVSRKKGLKITDQIVKDVLEGLVLSQGIGFRMASAILKFINPAVLQSSTCALTEHLLERSHPTRHTHTRNTSITFSN